jgi:hypothetical protein
MLSINDRLVRLYQENQKGIDAIYAREKNGEPYLDGPHLVHCWEESYLNAQHRILVLGQENNSWYGPSDEIQRMIDAYEEFEHGQDYHSPYWRGVHEFNRAVNGAEADRFGFVASNVCKYCSECGGPVTSEEDQFVVQQFNVLPGELGILDPSIVLFFSGPHYDDSIRLQLGGPPASFESTIEGISANEIAKVIHPLLPVHSYRTYHPNYLQRGKRWNFIRLIAALIKDQSVEGAMKAYRQLMRELAAEFSLLLEEPPGFPGNIYDGFYFYRPEWQWSWIGFEFEGNGAGSSFYGMCRKDSTIPVPAPVQEDLLRRLPAKEGSTEHWPWWRWSEHKDWNERTLEEIADGTMKEKVRAIVFDLLNRLDKAAI